jgi:hypothetical protein
LLIPEHLLPAYHKFVFGVLLNLGILRSNVGLSPQPC